MPRRRIRRGPLVAAILAVAVAATAAALLLRPVPSARVTVTLSSAQRGYCAGAPPCTVYVVSEQGAPHTVASAPATAPGSVTLTVPQGTYLLAVSNAAAGTPVTAGFLAVCTDIPRWQDRSVAISGSRTITVATSGSWMCGPV